MNCHYLHKSHGCTVYLACIFLAIITGMPLEYELLCFVYKAHLDCRQDLLQVNSATMNQEVSLQQKLTICKSIPKCRCSDSDNSDFEVAQLRNSRIWIPWRMSTPHPHSWNGELIWDTLMADTMTDKRWTYRHPDDDPRRYYSPRAKKMQSFQCSSLPLERISMPVIMNTSQAWTPSGLIDNTGQFDNRRNNYVNYKQAAPIPNRQVPTDPPGKSLHTTSSESLRRAWTKSLEMKVSLWTLWHLGSFFLPERMELP